MKTWVSSYLLARRLHFLLPPPPLSAHKPDRLLRSLELGSGTGLVGLSFAAIWGPAASTHLTDLGAIVPNLSHNTQLNAELLSQTGGAVTTGVLDWSIDPEPLPIEERFDIILAADPLYSPDHPKWLVQTIERWLSRSEGAKVIAEMPLRDAYLPQVAEFRRRMCAIGLQAVGEGEEVGYDDWESPDGGSLEVRCWWSVWLWAQVV
jgi:predicted nicotinamide N-methyase